MTTGIIEIIKKVALDCINAEQICDIRYGTVVSTSPLKIRMTNQFVIPEKALVVPKTLTNYDITMTVDEEEKLVSIHNALEVNDKVALLRQRGGAAYFILDRI